MTHTARIALLLAGTSSVLALTGCTLTPTAVPTPQTGTAIRGVVHGGTQPITNAHIYLFAANATGYGGYNIPASPSNASISLLNAAETGHSDIVGAYVLSDGNGDFTITGDYVCTPNSQVYIYALGGNTGAGPNEASGLMAILGNCPAAGNFLGQIPLLIINEVTTVAAAYAMAGFATDATHVSSSGTAAALLGIQNAFATAANLVSITTGAALTTTPSTYGTVPQAEINTLGDILASCVNTTGPSVLNPTTCNTLFTTALSNGTTGTQPTDTATAAIYIAHNPGANVSTLYYLAPSSPPFQPVLPSTTTPNDWSIVIGFLVEPRTPGSVAIDSQGRVWVVSSGGYNGNALVSQWSNNGYINSTSIEPGYQFLCGNYTQCLAVDKNDNLWGASSQAVSEVNSSGTLLSTPTENGFMPSSGSNSDFYGTWLQGVGGLAFDSTGNLWVGNNEGFYGHSTLVEVSSTGYGLFETTANAGGVIQPNFVAIDPSGNIWTANTGDSGGTTNTVVEYNPTTQTYPSGTSGYSVNNPYAIAFDHAGDAWIASSNNSITELSSGGTSLGTFTGGGLSSPQDIAIDGDGNVWLVGGVASGAGGLTEFNSAGTAVSPSTRYSLGGANQNQALAIDSSGNIWVSAFGGFSYNNCCSGGGFTETVGIAAPTVTPIAVATANNTLGTRP